VFPNVEVRHLLAVDILAQELNFTRAALRLNISQSALSRQITDLEEHYRFHLFTRDKRRAVELTDAGRVFVKEARSALFHIERAGHLAHAAHQGAVNVLMIGLSPCVEQDWISGLLTIQLPLYPRIRIRWRSQFPVDLVRSVLAGELDLALVAAPPEDSQITSVLLSRAQLYALVPEGHAAAHKGSLVLQDLAQDAWILFSKQVHPLLRSAIIDAAQREGIVPKDVHDILIAQEAFHLVAQHEGVAILTKPTTLDTRGKKDVVVKPLADTALCFETCLVLRAHEESRLINEFVRSYLRKYAPNRLGPTQMELKLPA
jgi:DNA-binding transcriptional LysR family regulator